MSKMNNDEIRIAFIGLLHIAKAHYLDMKGLLMMLNEEQILQLLNWSVEKYPQDDQLPTLDEVMFKAEEIRNIISNLVDGEGSVEMIKP